MILPKERDPRLITIRRGGTLTDSDHQLLALWAAACAAHVLDLFESVQPSDPRPRQAIGQVRTWARRDHDGAVPRGGWPCHGGGTSVEWSRAARCLCCRASGGGGACRRPRARCGRLRDQSRTCCRAGGARVRVGQRECRWQRDQLPAAIRALVIDDQRVRNDICWSVFDC